MRRLHWNCRKLKRGPPKNKLRYLKGKRKKKNKKKNLPISFLPFKLSFS
jgi:hypothetical protein